MDHPALLSWRASRKSHTGFTTIFTLSTTSGSELRGDYDAGSGATRDFAVVWVHGFGSHRGGEKAAAVRAESARRGWPFAAFDFRAHGDSPGRVIDLTASGLLADLDAVAAFLLSKGHTRFGLIGSSMGAFAAAWWATNNPAAVVGCVLLAPAFGFVPRRWDRLTEAEREDWKRTGRLRIKNQWIDTEIVLVTPVARSQVVLEDPLTPGFEPVRDDLALVDRGGARTGTGDETRRELRDDRVVFFFDELSPGVHRVSYRVRATTAGRFTVPEVRAECMYDPAVRARAAPRVVEVR